MHMYVSMCVLSQEDCLPLDQEAILQKSKTEESSSMMWLYVCWKSRAAVHFVLLFWKESSDTKKKQKEAVGGRVEEMRKRTTVIQSIKLKLFQGLIQIRHLNLFSLLFKLFKKPWLQTVFQFLINNNNENNPYDLT